MAKKTEADLGWVTGGMAGNFPLAHSITKDGKMYIRLNDGTALDVFSGEKIKGDFGGAWSTPDRAGGGEDKWLHSAWRMNKGGLVRGCGIAKKGKTRGKIV